MAAVGKERYFHLRSPYAQTKYVTFRSDEKSYGSCTLWTISPVNWAQIIKEHRKTCLLLQQKYSNIPCWWETQRSGCVRISCAFHHSKPRNINGQFLPPSNSAPVQQVVQGGTRPPAPHLESLRHQENIVLPVHPPLIINLNDDEDDEEDDEEEENDVSNWVPRPAADIEEERAVKEICYKSGEYYRIQHPHNQQSPKAVSSPWGNRLAPLEATRRDLQKADSNTIPAKVNNTEREGESSGRRGTTESMPRTDRRSFANGGIHTSDPRGKPPYQPRGQSDGDDTLSLRKTGRKSYFNPSEPRRSVYVVYRSVPVNQEPKFSGSTDKYTSGLYNAATWKKRNPHAKTFSRFKTTIQI
ncbi:uncharacterized protein C12orf50 homolog [Opisthocomus hoazin]|uniref:uncharacterized protein C12orf50 homolog n=1 Tax=Opisthocomus hoazin TaxID=30419 RepID=UPI003F52AA8B